MSKYFKDEEMACKCKCGLCIPNERLMSTLDAIRSVAGAPIEVTSGCRCTKHNASPAVKGVRSKTTVPKKGEAGGPGDSNHTHGTAADIKCAKLGPDGLYTLIVTLQRAGSLPYLAGMGRYNTFVHVDVEPKKPGRLRTWDERKA